MRRFWIVLAILCGLALIYCSKPATVTGKGKTLVIVCGGLGEAQTGDIVARLETIPTLTVISASNWDGYKANIVSLYNANKETKLVLIGHSFGSETVITACKSIPFVDCLILIDPVATDWGSLELPHNIGSNIVFYRSDYFGPKTANIAGGNEITIDGGHNDLPHNPIVIEKIVETVTVTQ
jgi:pimeloyl-ACP methyl ester carboxylesterase